MTCIVGIVDDGVTWIAGDSMAYNDAGIRVDRRDRKVFSRELGWPISEHMVFGVSGSYRVAQLLQYGYVLPERPTTKEDLMCWMCSAFIPGLRASLIAGGVSHAGDGEAEGWTIMAGLRDRLFAIYSDYQVSERDRMYSAIGAGAEVALGALYVIGLGRDYIGVPRTILCTALCAAEEHTTVVSSPFHWVNTKGESE